MATSCKCGIALEDLPSRVVKKEGHNKGKWFKACNGCGSFFWAPKQEPIAPESPISPRQVPNVPDNDSDDVLSLLLEMNAKIDTLQHDLFELRRSAYANKRQRGE